jgi:putative OPT family oligopeptide transporter
MATQDEPITVHKPYVPDEVAMPEFTFRAVAAGTGLGLIFAASSLYLVLKVGMTVSASIPVAVLAITLFRAFGKATILENNITQTAGSAGESIAFGVGVTMPALMMLGFEMELTRVMVVSILGGLVGILAMIPLRRAFIVKMHGRPGAPGTLLFPEGTACAQVLISGEKGGTTGTTVFAGFGLAFVHKLLTEALNLLVSTVTVPLGMINKAAVIAGDMASEMLGVGYIIGLRTSAMMMAGAVLGYLVIIPIIFFVGEFANVPVPPGEKLIKDMKVKEIRENYLLFIGAGCVATAGLISMFKTLPVIVKSIRSGLATVQGGGGAGAGPRRTEDDMPMSTVLLGTLGLIVILGLFLTTEVGVVAGVMGALLVVLFGFLFVTVSTRLTGEIGSSSNPISGMTTATLMVTCLIFLGLGWTSPTDRVLALSIAAVVCIASSNGGTTAQSLKTGFLVGGTPKYMQYAILIGSLVSALVIGATLLAFNRAGTVYTDDPGYLPKVTLTQEEIALLADKETFGDKTHPSKTYLIWDTRRDNLTRGSRGARPETRSVSEGGTAPEGRFLVDPDTGKVAFLKDPTIGGKVETHNGEKVNRYDAPKTKVMHLLIEGVLKQRLNWTLVLIGALIAVTMELLGVSALAFAVGLYVPIANSVPIFLGGIVRWLVDRSLKAGTVVDRREGEADAEYKARVEVEEIRRSETSPGVLLASGFIAGGSIGGVLVTFMEFSEDLKKSLDFSKALEGLGAAQDYLALALFGGLALFLLWVGMGKVFPAPEEGPEDAAERPHLE